VITLIGTAGIFVQEEESITLTDGEEKKYYSLDRKEINDNSSSNENSENNNSTEDDGKNQSGEAENDQKSEGSAEYRSEEFNEFDSVKLLREGQPMKGRSNILEIKDGGRAVSKARVYLQGELEGETSREGLFFFANPDADILEIKIEKDGKEALLKYEQQ
jgi:hypothetical protein